jgi:hypothetical protein
MRIRRCLMILLLALPAGAAESPPAANDLPKGVTAAPFEISGERIFVNAVLTNQTPTQNSIAQCKCLIDTGSELTLLNRARVQLKDLKVGFGEAAQGAFVGEIRAQHAVLKKLALGDHFRENVPINTIQHGKGQALELIDMVLGMDLLASARFSIDFKNNRILFWPPGSVLPRPAPGVERVQVSVQRGFRDEGTRPRIEAKINGKFKALFLVDFGADLPMYVATQPLADLGFKIPAGDPLGCVRVHDATVVRDCYYYAQTFEKVEFGAMAVNNVEGRILGAGEVSPVARQDVQTMYNILGTPFLKHFDTVHIDMPAKSVYFERTAPAKNK